MSLRKKIIQVLVLPSKSEHRFMTTWSSIPIRKNNPSPSLFFLMFVFYELQMANKYLKNTLLPMMEFEPRISGVRSDRSANYATTTALQVLALPTNSEHRFGKKLNHWKFLPVLFLCWNRFLRRCEAPGIRSRERSRWEKTQNRSTWSPEKWNNLSSLNNSIVIFLFIRLLITNCYLY